MIYGRRSTGIWFEVVRGKSVLMGFRPVTIPRVIPVVVPDEQPVVSMMPVEPVSPVAEPVTPPTRWARVQQWAAETWQQLQEHGKAGGYGS